MKTNIAKISQEWQAMLERGIIPLFEIELKDGEYLLVDLELCDVPDQANIFEVQKEIRFSFDSMNLKTWFSGNIKTYHDCRFALPITEYDDSLDELLEAVMQEITEGFILPNNLYLSEETN